jgi:hypothetical protein
LDEVDHATHHLSEGRFIGSFDEAVSALDRAAELIETSTTPDFMRGLAAEVEECRTLLSDWQTYQSAPSGTFPEWCRQRGRNYAWRSIVYYDP